ncbi:MAG: AAA family ATPase, partial [Pseudomonadota bacterium]
MAKTITVTSGKGGVGKTNLSANLSMQLAAQGYRTCIFDADLGLANINILFGMYPEKTIEDVIVKGVPLHDVIIKNYHGIDIIPGSSGVENIANLDSQNIEYLIKSFSVLEEYDYVFFDTSAGVSKSVV